MTVFSTFRKGRQAAKEHKAKQAEQEVKVEVKPAYRHIPSHAAIDALNATPQAWRHDDAPRIVEANRRHSERSASGYGRVSSFMSLNAAQFHSPAGTPGPGTTPRISSSLSHVAFPNGYHNPVVQVPRTYSVQSLQVPASRWPPGGSAPAPHLRRADTDGTPMPSLKGKGKAVDRSSAMPDPGRAGANPYSSGESTSSQDDLEMAGGSSRRHRAGSNVSQGFQSNKPSASGQPHRLHPARRISDPPALSPTKSTHHVSVRGESYYPPSASAKRPGPRQPESSHSSTSTPSATNGIPPVPIPPQGLVTSSSHSLSSSSSGGTNRSAEPADTPTTAPSPDTSPTQQNFKLEERPAAETYADIIPDFAPLGQGFVEAGCKAGTAMTMNPRDSTNSQEQQHRPAHHSERDRVTNFSRLSIRSNSSLTRENRPTPHLRSTTSEAQATSPQVQAPTPIRPLPQHASMSYERTSVNGSTLPTRFIESGFDELAPAHKPAPGPVPAAKGRKLSKRSSAASAPKEKPVEKSGKRSLWGKK